MSLVVAIPDIKPVLCPVAPSIIAHMSGIAMYMAIIGGATGHLDRLSDFNLFYV